MFSRISNLFNKDFREPIVLTAEAEERIKKELGFVPTEDIIEASGPRIIVKLFTGDNDDFIDDENGNKIKVSRFINKDGTKSNLIMPEVYQNHDLYTTCVGLVVGMNKSCYQSERFRLSGPHCRLGEWAIIPRNEGVLMYLKGHPVHIIYDDRVVGTVKDPKNVRRD